MWKKGTISIPIEDGKMVVCHYQVKYYEEPSTYGIKGGRISKLMIRINGKVTCNFDRGWDIEPEDRESQLALAILMIEHN